MAENGKSGRSAADRGRRSLTARTVRATLGSCVLLGLAALIIGLGFYTAGLTRQYIRHAFDIATYAQMSAGNGADSRGLAKQLMDIHGGLSEEDRQKVGTELSLATRIQASMLPHEFPPFTDRKEFGIYAVMDPAGEVGGDFYDFFLIDEDHLGMVMADVSGKGVPAALFMMAAKIILQSCAMLGRSASEILTKTNEAICSNNQAVMFVTVWIGIPEISTGHLTAANAGYEYPAVRRAGGDRQREPALRLGAHARGAERSARRRAGGLKNMRRAVDDFVGDAEQFDDLTMLCMEYRGPRPEAS